MYLLGSYRRRIDIIADILNISVTFVKKTQIMFRANLSYKVLQRYLAELVEASLISYEDDKRCYILTNKGREFLDIYEEYSAANKLLKRRLEDARSKKRALDKLCLSNI